MVWSLSIEEEKDWRLMVILTIGERERERGRERERERKIPRKYVSDPKSSVATEVVMKL